MANRSTFQLQILLADETNEYIGYEEECKITEEFCKGNESATYALLSDGSGIMWDEAKEELKEFSKKYPQYHFILDEDFEHGETLIKYHIINGKCQECYGQIVYDDFDRHLLE